MIRWVVYALVAVVVLVCLVAVIGYSLPKAHQAARTVTLNAPASDVFGAITNVARYPEWRSDVKRIEILEDDGHGLRFREDGDNGNITYRFEVRDPYTRVVARITDPSLPFGGSWTYDLKGNGPHTDLTITEDGEVYNPIFRFMSKFVFSPYASIDAYQKNLRKRLEG